MEITFSSGGAVSARRRDQFVVSVNAASDRKVLVDPLEDKALKVCWERSECES